MKHQINICFALSFVTFLALFIKPSTAIVDEWTSEGFDWAKLRRDHPYTGAPTGIWMNTSSIPNTTSLEVLAGLTNSTSGLDNHELITITGLLGLAWQVGSAVVSLVTLSDAVKACKPVEGAVESPKECAKGVFLSVFAIGAALGANPKLTGAGLRLVFGPNVRNDHTVDWQQNVIPMSAFDTDTINAQIDHNNAVRYHLSKLAHRDFQEPEFLGYADDDHRLARRDYGLHPLVPMFRFEHRTLGSLELASRATLNGTYISMASAGHRTHLLGRKRQLQLLRKAKRQEEYDRELLDGKIVEARFDAAASQADPAVSAVTVDDVFNAWKPSMDCFIDNKTPDDELGVLSGQMFDTINEVTFGYGSIGVFNSINDADSIENFLPMGEPLPVPSC